MWGCFQDTINYLCIALIMWAVNLIDDDRTAHILHDNVFEMHVGYRASERSWPSFDSDTIQGIEEAAIPDCHSDYRFFILILT